MIHKKSVALLSIINMASTLLGIGSSVVMARVYGVSPEVEVYFAATSLFFMITSLTQTGQLSEIVLPIYHRYKEKVSQEAANGVFSVILTWVGMVAIAISFIAFLLSSILYKLLVPGFDPSQLALGTLMFRLITPLIAIEIIKSLLVTLINAEKVFARIERITLVNQAAAIVLILAFHQKSGIYAALSGLLVGEVLSFLMAIFYLSQTPFKFRITFRTEGFELNEVLNKVSFTFMYVLSTQFWIFSFNAALSFLPQGYFAIFKYASLIYTKLYGLVLRPVSVVFFTQFSTLYQQGSSKLRELIHQANRLTFLLSISASALIISSSKPILNVLWKSGKFEADYIDTTFFTLVVLIVLVYFSGLGLIYRKMCMSTDLIKTQYGYLIVLQLLSGIFTYIFGQALSYPWLLAFFSFNNACISIIPILVIFNYKAELATLYQSNFLPRAAFFLIIMIGTALMIHFGLGMFWGNETLFQNLLTAAVNSLLLGMILLFALRLGGFEEIRLLGLVGDKLKTKLGKNA